MEKEQKTSNTHTFYIQTLSFQETEEEQAFHLFVLEKSDKGQHYEISSIIGRTYTIKRSSFSIVKSLPNIVLS